MNTSLGDLPNHLLFTLDNYNYYSEYNDACLTVGCQPWEFIQRCKLFWIFWMSKLNSILSPYSCNHMLCFLVVWRKLEGACESNIDVKVLLVNTHVRCIHKSSFKNKKTSNFSFGLDVCCLCNWFWFFKKLGDLLFWKWLRSLWLFLVSKYGDCQGN